MYDVIVVGARCAGSPTAMLLARRGYRVLVVDKARFPGDTISTHYIHQSGVAALKRWGILDRVVASGCPPITHFTFQIDDVRLVGSPPAFEGVREAYSVRRRILDKILVDAAVEAGAEVREAFTVTEVVREGDRVAGIRGHASDGETETLKARIVIGADGVRSVVARSVDAPHARYVPPLTCVYYGYFRDLPVQGAEVYPGRGSFVVATPTNDDLTQVTVFAPEHEFARRRARAEKSFHASLRQHTPELADRVSRATRVEKFYGTPLVPNYIRKPWGPGWALVGDAGYMKDPITAQGMSDAFRDAELLAGAVNAGFTARATMEQALGWYERQRDTASAPMFQQTCEMARLDPMPPQMLALLRAIQHRPEEVSRFFGTITGTTSILEFFSSENIERLIGASEPVAA
jgi:2-polyprenyl-6-methoxyphenol hydroxylase-like FAD-dependent oxidoreductase